MLATEIFGPGEALYNFGMLVPRVFKFDIKVGQTTNCQLSSIMELKSDTGNVTLTVVVPELNQDTTDLHHLSISHWTCTDLQLVELSSQELQAMSCQCSSGERKRERGRSLYMVQIG
ncbi:hypothetical protein DPMN_003680 [Dreissena polymorpha]|uniref:Uncharacterized protein n=1 Tax=Dreissena polymorpha TaxID=45954 RepID=A0A9D4MQ57_DREPO|nr:hypothetical protein DPMN_003680 [Dreissena polymorpha]